MRDSAQYFLAAGKNAEASEILLTLGQTCRENRHPGDAAEALATAFQIRLAGHDRAGAAGVLIEIAVMVKEYGRYEDAAHILQFAISLITEDPVTTQSQVRLAWAHENLEATLKHLGRADEAAIHHRASLAVFTRFGHLRGQAYAVRNLGDLALRAGALREAGESIRGASSSSANSETGGEGPRRWLTLEWSSCAQVTGYAAPAHSLRQRSWHAGQGA